MLWIGFFAFVLIVLAIDMFVLGGRSTHEVKLKEALIWSGVWIACALVFNLIIWVYFKETLSLDIANQKSLEFLTGFVIEKSLSIDNLFVFYMIFAHFAIPPRYQRRVLLYGVLGAIVMRLLMIGGGAWLVSQFHWVLYLFGIFLMLTSIKILFFADKKEDLTPSRFQTWLFAKFRVTPKLHGEHFFIRQAGRVYVTPLFLALILIEINDLIFSLDSIPAIFAITQDTFIVFTSNIFAILGLRALYFVLSDMAKRFYLLEYGIAFMLAWVGFKMLIEPWVVIPTSVALLVIFLVVIISIALSIWKTRKRKA